MKKTVGSPINIFRFIVQLTPKISRTIDISGTDDLYSFAEIIVKAFGFQFDHAFGFYSSLTGYDSDESYELFVDTGLSSSADSKKAYGVKGQLIQNVFSPDKKMLFLFDYGDDWQFLVTCIQKTPCKKEKFTALIIKDLSQGKAPKQYH